jgi:hypothetical protein
MNRHQRYHSRKPKGPVLVTPFLEAVATPTEKRGFVTSKFCGVVHHHPITVLGGMGRTVTPPARLRACYEHPVHPLPVVWQTVGFIGSLEGIRP